MNDSFITPLLLFSILPSFSTYPFFGHFCLINQKYDNLAYLVKKLWLSWYIMDNILGDYWDVSMQLDITVCKLWCTIIKYQWWCCGCILCFLWLRVYWTRLVCNMFYDCGILVASALPTYGNNPKIWSLMMTLWICFRMRGVQGGKHAPLRTSGAIAFFK